MLEIAGGIVIAVIALWLLAAFVKEIATLLWAIIKFFGKLYLFLGALTLGLCLLYLGGQAMVLVFGHHLATAICEPVVGLLVFVGPIALWVDSRDDFEMTTATYRWVVRNCRPSALKARFSRRLDRPAIRP